MTRVIDDPCKLINRYSKQLLKCVITAVTQRSLLVLGLSFIMVNCTVRMAQVAGTYEQVIDPNENLNITVQLNLERNQRFSLFVMGDVGVLSAYDGSWLIVGDSLKLIENKRPIGPIKDSVSSISPQPSDAAIDIDKKVLTFFLAGDMLPIPLLTIQSEKNSYESDLDGKAIINKTEVLLALVYEGRTIPLNLARSDLSNNYHIHLYLYGGENEKRRRGLPATAFKFAGDSLTSKKNVFKKKSR